MSLKICSRSIPKTISVEEAERDLRHVPELLSEGERVNRLRGASSIYVAMADTQDATLVTWDREMLDRGAAVVKTRTPKQRIGANARSGSGPHYFCFTVDAELSV